MTYNPTTTPTRGRRGGLVAALGDGTKKLFAKIGQWMIAYGEIHARTRQIEALMKLSDAQLAARGLTRETIVRHVFRDRLI
ncbi:hypothetical protein [Paracoccus pacificus]|uniref:DUF1127 domain-containing protein n=1 Tax=Paracoccus pacificus TaxID=1463598 RepID=A0ABW4R324_9RHOB